MKTEKIYTQHEENKEWLSNLLFFKDEIKVMEHRLEEIASKNTSKDVLKGVEHFQNQLIIQKNTIDTLKHGVTISEDALRADISKNETAADHRSVKDHTETREQVKQFEKTFKDLKSELNTALIKWM